MTATTQTSVLGVSMSPPRVEESSVAHGADCGAPTFVDSVGLTEREREILRLVASGLSNQQIAATIFVGVNTIKSYIRSTYRKLRVESRTQAVVWAFDHGLVEPNLSRRENAVTQVPRRRQGV